MRLSGPKGFAVALAATFLVPTLSFVPLSLLTSSSQGRITRQSRPAQRSGLAAATLPNPTTSTIDSNSLHIPGVDLIGVVSSGMEYQAMAAPSLKDFPTAGTGR